MVDFIAGDAVFALPRDSVYVFPDGYPNREEVYAPVWEGSGRTIPCVVVGDAAAPRRILLFHGNAQTIFDARPFARKLAAACDARVFMCEFEGYWRPENGPPGQRTARGVYASAKGAAELLKQGGDFHVVGFSLGTALAVRVARQHAESVISLSLIAPLCSALSVAATTHAEGAPPGLRAFIALAKPLLAPLDVFSTHHEGPCGGGARAGRLLYSAGFGIGAHHIRAFGCIFRSIASERGHTAGFTERHPHTRAFASTRKRACTAEDAII